MQTLKSTTQTKKITTNAFDIKLKPPIFILGSGRSGTSLLRSILNNHPDIYCMEGETHLFSPESNPYLEELEFFQSSNDIKSLIFTIISSILFGHECTALFARRKKFPKEVIEIYHDLQDFLLTVGSQEKYKIFNICIGHITLKENKKRWLEKTPNNIFNLPDILSLYPDAKFIEIYRDPRGVYYSWKNAKQDYFKKTNIIECIKKWSKTFEYSKKYAHELPNQFYKLKYENLVEDPKVELISLCNFLNEDFNQSLLGVTTRSLGFDETSSTTIWKDNLIKNELLLIDLKTKEYRKELGYIDSGVKLNLINMIPFCLFYIRNKFFGRINFLTEKLFGQINFLARKLFGRINLRTEKLFGRIALLINKYIAIANELLQSILRKPYSFRRKCKTLYWVIKRKRKVQEYIDTHKVKKLHIGAGPNMLKDWLNTNIMPITNEDIFLDASIRFPFDGNTFDCISINQSIEYLKYNQSKHCLNECFRVLKPDGKIRIITVNLENFIKIYSKKDPTKEEKDYIKFVIDSCMPDIGIYKNAFIMNSLFSRLNYKFIHDYESLNDMLEKIGFIYINFLSKNDFETLVVEARKP